MIRTLLTTTALALLLAAPAMAQNTTQPAAPAADTNMMAPNADMLAMGYMVADSDNLATRILGQPVYTSAANDAEKIGDVNDIVLTEAGQVGAVVIGVGGFLGVGEKNVAVDFKALQFTTAADNTERWILPTTKDALTAAADFQWRDDQPADTSTAANGNAAGAPTTTAPDVAQNASNANANAVTQGMQGSTETAANPNAATPGTRLDVNTLTPLDTGTLTAEKVIGTEVVGQDNQEIAEVGDIVLTPDGKVDSLLIDFGGFLGIGEKRVAVGMDNLKFMTDAGGKQYVFVNVTRDQLNAAPAYDEASYAANRDTQRLVVTE